MTDDRKQKEQTKPKKELDDILRRVDSLPVLDPRSPDEIIGYDKDGLATQCGTGSAENTFDFDAYRKKVLADPKAEEAIEFFLKHRHREWEENLCADKEKSPGLKAEGGN
jgi:hypothetical protein